VWFDVDRPDDLDAALHDTRRLAAVILQRYPAMDDDDLLLFFSGSKGFHVGLPITWNPEPSTVFHRVARHFAEGLATLAGVRIDTSVYDRVRLFRAPNSRHAKTGLHKRRLTLHELMHLPADRVRQLASEPTPFVLPAVPAADPQAVRDWQAAEAAVAGETEMKAQRSAAVTNGAARLNRLTMDFLRDGAAPGTRALRLFSAAANLGEFGCPPALAHALLTEPALNSGLSPNEVKRQIECGLNHVDGHEGNGNDR
jgi:hypothetical protein